MTITKDINYNNKYIFCIKDRWSQKELKMTKIWFPMENRLRINLSPFLLLSIMK